MILKSHRIIWVDILKGIGIFYVVLGHVNIKDLLINKYISSFHMPLFFIISGYLFTNNKYNFSGFCKRKFETLIIPYIIFALLGVPFNLLLSNLNGGDFNIIKSFIGIATSNYLWNGPLWFLTCLFLVEIIYYIIKIKFKNNLLNFVVLLISIIGILLSKYHSPLFIWRFDIAFAVLLLFHIGNILRNSKVLYHIFEDKFKLLAVLLCSICLQIFIGLYLNTQVTVSRALYGNFIYFYIAALSGTAFYICISYIVSRYRIVSIILGFLGENSLIIMCLHWFLIYIVTNLASRINITNPFIITFMILVILVPVIKLINRYFPMLIGKRYLTGSLKSTERTL